MDCRNELRIGQVNLGRGKAATDCLVRAAVRLGIDVLLIQEPYTLRGKIIGFPSSSRVIAGGDQTKWAAIVVMNPRLGVVTISQFTSQHSAVAEIYYRGRNYIFGSLYCQYSLPVEPFIQRIGEVFDACDGRQGFIGADVNSKSTRWGGNTNDSRGTLVAQLIDGRDLALLNDYRQPATYSSTRGESWIDISLGSRGTERSAKHWTVHDAEISDHRLITWSVVQGANNSRMAPVKSRLNWRKTNWELLASEMERLRSEHPDSQEPDADPEERLAVLMADMRAATRSAVN